MAEDDYAVIVAVSRYGAYPTLKGPVVVAEEFRQWLLHPHGGNVPHDHLHFVVSPRKKPWSNPHRARPNVDQVDTAFRYTARGVFQHTPIKKHRLYIYLVGHGIMPTLSAVPKISDAALLMANADEDSLGLHVAGYSYAEWFRNARAFDEIILFMDCCHVNRPDIAPRMPPFPRRLHADASIVHCVYAYSTLSFKKSFERPIPERDDKELPVFSVAMLEGLQGAAANGSGVITAWLLQDYIDKRLQMFDPTFRSHFEGPDLHLAAIPAAPRALYNVKFAFKALFKEFDVELRGPGNTEPTSIHVDSNGAAVASLRKGLYKASSPNWISSRNFEVYGFANQSVDLRT